MIASDKLAERCAADGEFGLAARGWTGGLRLQAGGEVAGLRIDDGVVAGIDPPADVAGLLTLTADPSVWAKVTSAKPPRMATDVSTLVALGEMRLDGDPVRFAQYFPAVMRAVELLRPEGWATAIIPAPAPTGAFDAPVGRYVHLDLAGQDHRIYFEEAGSGIPLLLQHTAGAHGAQWRHLFECREITDHFRLIAYDLPFHGKSLPPVGPAWWAERYELKGAFLRSVPVTLARTLGLERPVFMGCSVGGLLALDLAYHHPDLFSAVISLEGALKIPGDSSEYALVWHPQVGNEYKARVMNCAMSPTSPEVYRRETMQVYASGWPPAFLGDLHYYLEGYDLREAARSIDTRQVGVHILSGEYDPSGTLELGREAHEAIAGSTWTPMAGMGHFPMSEDPDAFIGYLAPVLEQIRSARR